MDIENQEAICCADDDDYRVYCDICEILGTERVYKNHLKSQTDTNNSRKRKQFK